MSKPETVYKAEGFQESGGISEQAVEKGWGEFRHSGFVMSFDIRHSSFLFSPHFHRACGERLVAHRLREIRLGRNPRDDDGLFAASFPPERKMARVG